MNIRGVSRGVRIFRWHAEPRRATSSLVYPHHGCCWQLEDHSLETLKGDTDQEGVGMSLGAERPIELSAKDRWPGALSFLEVPICNLALSGRSVGVYPNEEAETIDRKADCLYILGCHAPNSIRAGCCSRRSGIWGVVDWRSTCRCTCECRPRINLLAHMAPGWSRRPMGSETGRDELRVAGANK